MAFLAPVGGLRTIWIMIRGQNYARQAMKEAGRDLTELEKKQQRLRRASQMMIFSGLLQVTMWGLLTGAMFMFATKSAYASRILRGFNITMKRFIDAFGKEFLTMVRPFLRILESIMRGFTRNRVALRALIQTLLGLAIIGVITGMIKIFHGAFSLLIIPIMQQVAVQNQLKIAMASGIPVIQAQATSWQILGMAVKSALGWFMIIFSVGQMLKMVFGDMKTAIMVLIPVLVIMGIILWKMAGAVAILSFGIAAAMGVGAMIAMEQAIPTMPSYQEGTRFVRRTTPAIVHEGEEIRRRERPLRPALAERTRERRARIINITQHIGTLRTRANREEMVDLLKTLFRSA